jgi:two-component system, NtrC family, response regulator
MKSKILIIDDDPEIRTQLKWALAADYELSLAENRSRALEQFKIFEPDITLLDLGLPPRPHEADEGLATLSDLMSLNPSSKVIVVSGQGEKKNAIEAVAGGAYDFLCKPIDLDELKLILRRCLYLLSLEMEYREMQQKLRPDVFENMLGTSPQMQGVFAFVRKVAGTSAPVLLMGESGTGKEMAAVAIHRRSSRKDAQFTAINCNAIPENLLESELFGYEKGAFTGATSSKPGKFELADKGTLFLDEIGDVPAATQVKLLRVLQEREFERLGGTKTMKVDVRLIAATNRDLRAALEDGSFREDLYYRLNVVAIDIPPLREHKEDVPELAQFFLEKYGREAAHPVKGITSAAMKLLVEFHWPGNVRELENVMQRAVTLARGETLDVDDIHLDRPHASNNAAPVLPPGMTLEQWEQEIIREALRQANGNKSQAARALGLSRNALRYRLSQMGVPDPENKNAEDAEKK